VKRHTLAGALTMTQQALPRMSSASSVPMGPAAPTLTESTFRFIGLSPEIRNMVYEIILVDRDYSVRFASENSRVNGWRSPFRQYRTRPGRPDREDIAHSSKSSISKSLMAYKLHPSFPQHEFNLDITCEYIKISITKDR
jgi:hypothetical protein